MAPDKFELSIQLLLDRGSSRQEVVYGTPGTCYQVTGTGTLEWVPDICPSHHISYIRMVMMHLLILAVYGRRCD